MTCLCLHCTGFVHRAVHTAAVYFFNFIYFSFIIPLREEEEEEDKEEEGGGEVVSG